MLNDRISATLPIAKSLQGAEKALNQSIRHMGTLMVNIADAKDAKGTRFALNAGVAAGEQVALAAASALQSFKMMIAAHAHLAEDRDCAGLGAVSFGDLCEVGGSSTFSPSALRVVGD